LKPQDGKPVTVPTQDMVLGSYYLTMEKESTKDAEGNILKQELGEGKAFASPDEARMAYDNGVVSLHARIRVRVQKEFDGVMKSKIIKTTVGKIIFNQAIRRTSAM
jgi:DNA-directed RNA polymerase subunit beta'